MVDLVLDAHREQAVGSHFEGLAVAAERPDANAPRPLHVVEDPGHRQAALLRRLDILRFDHLRVHQGEGLVMVLGDVRDQQTTVNIDLRRSKTDAFAGIHGLEHVVDQGSKVVVHDLDGLCDGSQSRVGILEYCETRHANRAWDSCN